MYNDATTYIQGDKERKQRVFENNSSGVRFTVHKHINYGETWLLSCLELNVDKMDLHTEDMDEAKEKAITEMIILFGKAIQKYQKAIRVIN